MIVIVDVMMTVFQIFLSLSLDLHSSLTATTDAAHGIFLLELDFSTEDTESTEKQGIKLFASVCSVCSVDKHRTTEGGWRFVAGVGQHSFSAKMFYL